MLEIPSLKVNARVIDVGLDENGDMETPKSWWDVGWYAPGIAPGEHGSAVLAGHLDSDVGPAVFWRLDDLRPGDELFVVDDEGFRRRFVVFDKEWYDADAAPMHELFRSWGAPRMVLITCGGDWSSGGYDRRLAIFAEPATPHWLSSSMSSVNTTRRLS